MPWLETAPVNERTRFIADDRLGLYTTTELCARYNISRKTGYKWLARYHEDGRRGLTDRSHAPHHCPHRMAPEIAELLCAARRHHPDWGSGKLLDWLAPRHPEIAEAAWPAVSTAGDLLAREGLVKRRRRRRPHQHPGVVPPTTAAPNDLWTADFKGQFPTRDGVWCYPLTIADQHTRYLLACRGLANIKGRGARPVFEHTSTHSPRLAPGERRARADAQDSQSRRVSTPARDPPRAAARVQSLSEAVQRRAAARLSRRPDPQLTLPRLAAPVSRRPPPTRVPRPLPRETSDQRRHVLAQAQAALHRQRAQTASHRPRRNRRRRLVDLLRDRPARQSRRTRDDHSGLTVMTSPHPNEVLPILPVNSVTYLPGCSAKT